METRCLLALALLFLLETGYSQTPEPPFSDVVGTPPPGVTTYYVKANRVFACPPSPGPCGQDGFIPASHFATASSVPANIGAQLDALGGQITRSRRFAAIGAAVADAMPNPGDRYAFRVNFASASDVTAGAVGLAVNVGGPVRVLFNYGRAQRDYIGTIGVNVSIK